MGKGFSPKVIWSIVKKGATNCRLVTPYLGS